MGIRYINGKRLRYAILAGSERVIQNQEHLNKINVYPVPDGDTGTNMASTLAHISHGTLELKEPCLPSLSASIADSALSGARGNSGAIIAQFFQGLAEAVGNKRRIDLKQFSEAIDYATQKSKQAVANPVDGTIITVMADWALWIKTHWESTDSFESLLEESLTVAKCSLKNTTNQLDNLAKANVVDAGAQGFVNFLEGVVGAIHHGKLKKMRFRTQLAKSFSLDKIQQIEASHQHSSEVNAQSLQTGDLNYQYCTECIIQGKKIDVNNIRAILKEWGDSQVVISGNHKVKIHIHTNDPNRLFKAMGKFGEVVGIKFDDMWAQYRNCIGWYNSREIAVITDTACSIPQESIVKYNIHLIPLQVTTQRATYLDRINLDSDVFYDALDNDDKPITTSQPLPMDITNIYSKVSQVAGSAIVFTISGNMSGTYQSAQHLAKNYSDYAIEVIDTNNISCGQGIIVQLTVEAIHSGISREELKRLIPKWIKNTTTFCAPRTMKNLVRGGRISKHSGFVAQLLNLLPLISVDSHSQGKPQKKFLLFGKYFLHRKLIKEIVALSANRRNVRIVIAHALAPEDAERVRQEIMRQTGIRDIPITLASPALTAHVGRGTVSAAIYGEPY